MGWYIVRRIIHMIPVFLGATFLIFSLVFLLPGDPIAALAGDKALSPATVAALRERYLLDEPFLVQYFAYLRGIFTGDLGTSFSGRPVSEELALALPITARLALMALAIEAVLGIGLGLVAGLRKGGFFDGTALFVSLVVIAVPVFVIGFVMQYLVGIVWGVLPATVGPNVSFRSLLMPALVLASISLAYVVRLTRASVAENLSQDFVRTARAKGLSNRRVVMVHVLRNSLIPVVTFLGVDLGSLMAGGIVTEGIFNIPGVGWTVYQALVRSEGPTVVSFITVLVVVYIVANLVVDLLYALLDPRIRYA